MAAKRELSSSPTAADDITSCPSSGPRTPKKKRVNKSGKAVELDVSPKEKKSPSADNGTWTPEKRQELVAELWTAGVSAVDQNELANRLGVTKKQLVNAICKGRSSYLREKVLNLVGAGI